METHGGYVCLFEDVDVAWLQRLAVDAFTEDHGEPDDIALQVSVLGGPRIVRFAFDTPLTYGRKGARWYEKRHAFARKLSEHLSAVVHAYVFDPDELELVASYGNGRRVGGEVLRYEDAEMPEEEEGDDEESFARLQSRWPLGHLARVLGIPRAELLKLPRESTALIDLTTPHQPMPLWQLFPEAVRKLRATSSGRLPKVGAKVRLARSA